LAPVFVAALPGGALVVRSAPGAFRIAAFQNANALITGSRTRRITIAQRRAFNASAAKAGKTVGTVRRYLAWIIESVFESASSGFLAHFIGAASQTAFAVIIAGTQVPDIITLGQGTDIINAGFV
jgi:hypothetical protein